MTTLFENLQLRRKNVSPQHIGGQDAICSYVERTFPRSILAARTQFAVTCNFTSPQHIECAAGKRTYYVRKKGGTFTWPPFSPHVLKKPPHNTMEHTAMDRIEITLPYPPSVNHYWESRVIRRGARYVPSVRVSEAGLRYQQTVGRLLDGAPKFAGPVRAQILVQPPDRRTRDLDNVLKALLDSLTKAGVWDDDSQVASLLVVRGDQVDGGAVLVVVEDLP